MAPSRDECSPSMPALQAETTPLLTAQQEQQKRHSVFASHQKHWIILTAALASSFSPLSANIYYPALNSIAEDLGVSTGQINMTITTYMVMDHLHLLKHQREQPRGLPQETDLPRTGPDIRGFHCRPSRSPSSIHLLLRDLHAGECSPSSPA